MDLELKLYECREYDSIDDYVEPSISDLLRQPKVVDFITKEAGKGNGCTKTTKIIKEKFGINAKPSTINNIMRERGIKVVTTLEMLRQPMVLDIIRKEASKGNGAEKIEPEISKMLDGKINKHSIDQIMRERGIKVVTKQDILEDQYNSVIKLKNSGKTYNEIVEIFSKKYNRRFAEDDIKLFFCKQKTKK